MTEEEINELKHFLEVCGEIYQGKKFRDFDYDDSVIMEYYQYVLDNPDVEDHEVEYFGQRMK